MKEIMQSIFGTYEPLSYINEFDEVQYIEGIAGWDMQYILGVLLFCICLYSLFRIIGIIIKN